MTEKRFELVPCYATFDGQKCLLGTAELMDTFGELSGVVENDITVGAMVDKLNNLHEEVMDLRRENTKFKLTVSEIIEGYAEICR